MTKAERYAFEYEHIALTLIALIEQGFLVVNKDRLKNGASAEHQAGDF